MSRYKKEVLIQESLEPVILDFRGCRVIRGRWYDPYTDTYYTSPRKLDIDHPVPLTHVHYAGGYKWSKEKKIKYANDLNNPNVLIAVSNTANRSKGYKSPDLWMPKNKKFHCEYIEMWMDAKNEYGLEIDTDELVIIKNIKNKCNQQINFCLFYHISSLCCQFVTCSYRIYLR